MSDNKEKLKALQLTLDKLDCSLRFVSQRIDSSLHQVHDKLDSFLHQVPYTVCLVHLAIPAIGN